MVGHPGMRKILYISGTRADFGLIRATLELAKKSELLDISICVTGNHLLAEYGNTSDEIKNSGLRISGKIPVSVSGQSGEEMTEALGSILSGLVQIVSNEKPDIILVLGDRGEMLMAAIASLHMNIPIVHIHGGELSGTVDESIRHAISKLSHFHFVVTQKARERLIQMGEKPDHIFVTGAPGLVDINKSPLTDKVTLCRRMGFDHEKKIALLIYHPVVQEMHETGQQMAVILDALSEIP
jgi:GDP/UDP-N,N'-diacetylbacillosamine 2-epimerase (hydrolysing)